MGLVEPVLERVALVLHDDGAAQPRQRAGARSGDHVPELERRAAGPLRGAVLDDERARTAVEPAAHALGGHVAGLGAYQQLGDALSVERARELLADRDPRERRP